MKKDILNEAIAEAPNRRRFMSRIALAGAAVGLAASNVSKAQSSGITDVDILNFALNLEYLEAEFYQFAVYGHGLSVANSTGGDGSAPGFIDGGTQVSFSTPLIAELAAEIANDEYNHVVFLRSALGSMAVARPAIDLVGSFTTLARAAGVVGPSGTFNPYANESDFLLGAFIFEDVGVTAYLGAAQYISNKDYLTAAGGILAVEAYHASAIRTQLIQMGLKGPVNKISALRAALSSAVVSGQGDDAGIGTASKPVFVPTDANSIAYARTTGQVLNIVYGGGASSDYLFYPNKLNGTIS
jgi:hypothetical protein